jgi:DNA-directed RNA polymerase subunit RPC12/RpoP
MHFTDVGYIDGLGQAATFACKRCGFKSDWQGASDTEIRRGVPCPSCNDRGETCLG